MTKKIAFLGLMLAVVTVLSALEHMIPPIPFLPPNVKLGLANIVTMYCVFFIGASHAVTLNILKSCFVFLIRGPMAAMLSFCGGMLSIFVIIVLVYLFKNKISYVVASIFGAVAHNIGQIVAVSFIFGSGYVLYMFPILLVSGVVMGVITGTLLKVVLPVFEKVLKF